MLRVEELRKTNKKDMKKNKLLTEFSFENLIVYWRIFLFFNVDQLHAKHLLLCLCMCVWEREIIQKESQCFILPHLPNRMKGDYITYMNGRTMQEDFSKAHCDVIVAAKGPYSLYLLSWPPKANNKIKKCSLWYVKGSNS
jgi:hypothetical protein